MILSPYPDRSPLCGCVWGGGGNPVLAIDFHEGIARSNTKRYADSYIIYYLAQEPTSNAPYTKETYSITIL